MLWLMSKCRYTISELILVMADLKRTFTGTIKRGEDSGRPVFFGSVKVIEGMIYSMAQDEESLGRNLDDMCLLKLDHGLHHSEGVFIEIFNSKFFLN